jgi:4-alpha-glucanotransferase
VRWWCGIFSYELFSFERNPEDEFKKPEEYLSDALASVTTHDLPPRRGYLGGCDISMRRELNLIPSEKVINNQTELGRGGASPLKLFNVAGQ